MIDGSLEGLKVSDENIPISEKVLLILHSLCAVKPEIAKTGDELSNYVQVAVDRIGGMLDKHEEEGYVNSYVDHYGAKKYYLTGRGIIKVCSSFT